DAVPPFDPCGGVAETGAHHRVLARDRAPVEIAVQRPGLHLPLVELAAMQQPVERMQIVIARCTDVAQHRFEVIGVVERDALADRQGGHLRSHIPLGHDIHSVISVPSAGICQPACSTAFRSSEPASRAGLELLICRNSFRPISRPARLSIAPCSPDIEICPIPCPVLVPSPWTINSSSRHTVPSKNTSAAPARRDLRSSVTSAQAARKWKYLPLPLSRIRKPSVSPAASPPVGCALPSRYHAPLPGTAKGRISMPDGAPSGSSGSN